MNGGVNIEGGVVVRVGVCAEGKGTVTSVDVCPCGCSACSRGRGFPW